MTLPSGRCEEYIGALYGERVKVNNGYIQVNVRANSGEIWVPADKNDDIKAVEAPQEIGEIVQPQTKPEEPKTETNITEEAAPDNKPAEPIQAPPKQEKTYEEGIEALKEVRSLYHVREIYLTTIFNTRRN